MPLNVLCAGCSKDEREQAEAAVRSALGRVPADESWRVSLVRISDKWSIKIEGPDAGRRSATILTPHLRLRESVLEALGGLGLGPAAAAAPEPARRMEQRSAQERCERCGGGFLVQYESAPGEPLSRVPVACPHCWYINQALVAEEAAASRDYRSEKPAV